MSPVTHQTVHLGRGKHTSPSDGACVMELASMLAGDPFTDHPRSVCPVIGSLLRAYNDSIDDSRRQDLYAYAAKAVGSAVGDDVQLARAQHLRRWARSRRPRRWTFSLGGRVRALLGDRHESVALAGPRALRAIPRQTDEAHASILELIDDLLAIGRTPALPDLADSYKPTRCHDTNAHTVAGTR
jgi:hypothetical protein